MTEALLGLDHWQSISKFLTVREMGRLMCVSRDWFHRWVDDRLWLFQKQRICAQFPSLEPLFDKWRPKKRHRQEWCMPRKGIWWVFKHFLSEVRDMRGIKKLCKNPSCHPLVLAVVSTSVECRELISDSNILSYATRNRSGTPMYDIMFWFSYNWISFTVKNSYEYFECCIYRCKTGNYNDMRQEFESQWVFRNWQSILFQKNVPLSFVATKRWFLL